jgi:hypothetical protein
MKKFLYYVFIFIVNVLLFFVLAEIACYINITWYQKVKYYNLVYKTYNEAYEYIKNKRFVQPIGIEYKNPPVLIFGGSFAYGYKLDVEDSFAGKISELMKAPVYNRAFEWLWNPSNMLYQVRRKDFYDEVPNPQYVIYVLINNHIYRMNSKFYDTRGFYPYLYYKFKNNRLEEDKWKFTDNLYIIKKFGNIKLMKKSGKELTKNFNEYFIETKQEMDKYWKDYKFIILMYDEREGSNDIFYKADLDKLKDEGFIIIHTKDLVGRYMDSEEDVIEDNFHPSASAWALITPKLVEKIKNTK